MTPINNQQVPIIRWKRYVLGGSLLTGIGLLALIANRQYIATTPSSDIHEPLSTALYVFGIVGCAAGIVCLIMGIQRYLLTKRDN
jgi:hypothetical protein